MLLFYWSDATLIPDPSAGGLAGGLIFFWLQRYQVEEGVAADENADLVAGD